MLECFGEKVLNFYPPTLAFSRRVPRCINLSSSYHLTQAPGSLCQRTCDACRDPRGVAESLRKLGHFSSNRQRRGLAPVFMNRYSESLPDLMLHFFWKKMQLNARAP